MKACQYCTNTFEPDIINDHEQLCAKNPANLEKARKERELERFVKTVVLKDGEIQGMYEAHSRGNNDYPPEEIERIRGVWRDLWPDRDHTSVTFLRLRGFAIRFIDDESSS